MAYNNTEERLIVFPSPSVDLLNYELSLSDVKVTHVAALFLWTRMQHALLKVKAIIARSDYTSGLMEYKSMAV